MPRVKCPAQSCVFWDEGFCTAEEIELDPEELSCVTYEELGDLELDDDEELEEDLWEEEISLEDLEEQETEEEEEWL